MTETEGEHSGACQPGEGVYGGDSNPSQACIDRGNTTMGYKGYVKGDVVILKEPLPVPDGTEVEIFIPPANNKRRQGRGKSSVAQATFGVIPSDPAVVHAVLEEDLYEA